MTFVPTTLPAPIFGVRPVRVVSGRPATVTLTITDSAGQPLDATGSVTWTLANGAGTQLATGTATHGTTGIYTATITPPLPDQDVLTWAATISGAASSTPQLVNVVGQRLVELPTLQADPQLANVSASSLLSTLADVEDAFDTVLGFPCVPRGERSDFWVHTPGPIETFPTVTGLPYGAGAPRLLVPDVSRPIAMLACQRWWADISDLSLVEANGRGAFEFVDGRGWPPGPYRVHVAHGMNPPPGDLRAAGALLIRYLARTDSQVPERAASVQTSGANIVIALPTPDRPSGLPSVDVVLNRYREGGAAGIAI